MGLCGGFGMGGIGLADSVNKYNNKKNVVESIFLCKFVSSKIPVLGLPKMVFWTYNVL